MSNFLFPIITFIQNFCLSLFHQHLFFHTHQKFYLQSSCKGFKIFILFFIRYMVLVSLSSYIKFIYLKFLKERVFFGGGGNLKGDIKKLQKTLFIIYFQDINNIYNYKIPKGNIQFILFYLFLSQGSGELWKCVRHIRCLKFQVIMSAKFQDQSIKFKILRCCFNAFFRASPTKSFLWYLSSN